LALFRKLDETERFRGSLVQVVSARFEGPGGDVFEREVVHHPGAVVVVPVTKRATAVMIRQYRAAVEAELLELPAGKRDVDGEAPEVTARRELAEEVGLRAASLELLARFYNSPGFSNELTWLYLARHLEAVPLDRQGVEERHMTVVEVALDEVAELVASGEILDAKSILGLCLAADAIGTRGGARAS
jgi:8-oxo-dGTP pyrophosphatase MutT (NUDIX family)